MGAMLMLLLAAQAQVAQPLTIEALDAVRPGTAAGQVSALFPEGPGVRHRPDAVALDDVAVGGDCEADGEIRLAEGAVREIELRGGGSLLGRCGGRVLEALVARFGAPDSERSRGETPWRRSRSTYEWRRGGQTLRYVRYTSAGYAGSGLASASWVLTVSGGGSGASGGDD
ncbi:MAG TPA: hypothetical protein VF693_06850 [Allosphingosinicella sp.]|jgi:hypothetical protein